METKHDVYYSNSNNMSDVESGSVQLMTTSPPYPMIEMWDSIFLKGECAKSFKEKRFYDAYYLMHQEMNKTWNECYRVLCDGGIACVNIGDACRTLDKNFYYFTNHSTIVEYFVKLGFQCLPPIVWRKPSNKPNKFMGSGMLPPGAYPTLEQEYIMIFRKGGKREIKDVELRRNSAYFWEERNIWFNDCWEKVLGVKQKINRIDDKIRERNASFPIEIPLRLIYMFSMYGDVVLDPFWGAGTTSIASILAGRNSIGYEICPEFKSIFDSRLTDIKQMSENLVVDRMSNHLSFIEKRTSQGKDIKHYNNNHNFKVMTSQEKNIQLFTINSIAEDYNVSYNKCEFIEKDIKNE